MQHRLFTAIDLPASVKDQLTLLLSGLPGAKWVKRPQLHLTLRFIGEVETPKFKAIGDTLREVQAQAFEMRLNGVGRFPAKGTPRVLWVGVDETPPLLTLYQQIEGALAKLDYPPEERPFSAHITLARFKEPPNRDHVERYLTKHQAFQTEVIAVHEFVLFSSLLSPQGPSYKVERVYALGS
jgi:2'-5' RNA ligase